MLNNSLVHTGRTPCCVWHLHQNEWTTAKASTYNLLGTNCWVQIDVSVKSACRSPHCLEEVIAGPLSHPWRCHPLSSHLRGTVVAALASCCCQGPPPVHSPPHAARSTRLTQAPRNNPEQVQILRRDMHTHPLLKGAHSCVVASGRCCPGGPVHCSRLCPSLHDPQVLHITQVCHILWMQQSADLFWEALPALRKPHSWLAAAAARGPCTCHMASAKRPVGRASSACVGGRQGSKGKKGGQGGRFFCQHRGWVTFTWVQACIADEH